MFDEPLPDIGMISDVLSNHLIKEGVRPERYKKLLDQLISSINSSLVKFEGKQIPLAVRVLFQYQVIGASEVLDTIEKVTSNDSELLEKISRLRERILFFSNRFPVNGFTDGQFDEVIRILSEANADLEREKFYPKALRYGFDYSNIIPNTKSFGKWKD